MKLLAAVIFALTTTALAQSGAPAQPEGQPSNKAAPVVLPGATKAALKQMPEFRYSRDHS